MLPETVPGAHTAAAPRATGAEEPLTQSPSPLSHPLVPVAEASPPLTESALATAEDTLRVSRAADPVTHAPPVSATGPVVRGSPPATNAAAPVPPGAAQVTYRAARLDEALAPRTEAAPLVPRAAPLVPCAAAPDPRAAPLDNEAAAPLVPRAATLVNEAAAPLVPRAATLVNEAAAPRTQELASRDACAGAVANAAETDRALHRRAANPFRHWLSALNTALGVFLLGAFAAPALSAVGIQPLADWLYAVYHFTCHQWAFRSFFLFGSSGAPITVYDQAQLAASTPDAFGFVGSADFGWKMAICERDLAIYAALLVAGLVYARRRHMQPAGYIAYVILILPMAVDGFTQLFGWRESTWQLRVATGMLFGLASAWLVLPRLDAAFGLRPDQTGTSCDPHQPAIEPWISLSRRG
jgi:uncharacterized membrane protein